MGTVKWKGNHVFQQLNLPDGKKLHFGNSDDFKAYEQSGDLILYGSSATAVKITTGGNTKIEGAFGRPVAWKGSSYTVLATDTGKVFVTNSATAEVIFTLPKHASGFWASFVNASYQAMTIQHLSGDCLVVAGDPQADKISFATASMQVGAACDVACDGSRWLVLPHYWNTNLSTHGSVVTVTT